MFRWLLSLFIIAGLLQPIALCQTNPAPGARTLVQGGQGNATTRLVWPVTIGGADASDITRVLRTDTSGNLVTSSAGAQTTTGTITALNGAVTLSSTLGVGVVGVQLTGTWTATITWQGSLNGTDWVTLFAQDSGYTGALQSSVSTNGIFLIQTAGYAAVRVTATAYTSGTVNVTLLAAPNPHAYPVTPIGGAVALADAASNTLRRPFDARGSVLNESTFGHTYNGTSWDRMRSANGASNTTGTGLLGSAVLGWDGTNYQLVGLSSTVANYLNIHSRGSGVTLADGETNSPTIAVSSSGGQIRAFSHTYEFNGSTWDRRRNNAETTLLSSAARTATTASSNQTNYNGRGVTVFLNVTVNPGGGETLNLQLQAIEPASGAAITIAQSGAIAVFGSGAAATGTEVIQLFPGAAETAALTGWTTQALALPRSWRINVVHSAAGSWTYSAVSQLVN